MRAVNFSREVRNRNSIVTFRQYESKIRNDSFLLRATKIFFSFMPLHHEDLCKPHIYPCWLETSNSDHPNTDLHVRKRNRLIYFTILGFRVQPETFETVKLPGTNINRIPEDTLTNNLSVTRIAISERIIATTTLPQRAINTGVHRNKSTTTNYSVRC